MGTICLRQVNYKKKAHEVKPKHYSLCSESNNYKVTEVYSFRIVLILLRINAQRLFKH